MKSYVLYIVSPLSTADVLVHLTSIHRRPSLLIQVCSCHIFYLLSECWLYLLRFRQLDFPIYSRAGLQVCFLLDSITDWTEISAASSVIRIFVRYNPSDFLFAVDCSTRFLLSWSRFYIVLLIFCRNSMPIISCTWYKAHLKVDKVIYVRQ